MAKRKSKAEIQAAREELDQRHFDHSFDEREVEDQEDFDPGELKDPERLKKLLKQKPSQRSGDPAKPLTDEQLKDAADKY